MTGGVEPAGFDLEKRTLIDMVKDFPQSYGDDGPREHPYFGNLSKNNGAGWHIFILTTTSNNLGSN